MKPTNYHLFDFLDFDPDLSRDESLWKAYKPTSVYEKDGDICINVPFQKQVLSNDMAPDTAFPREEYTLVIRQYTSGITRLFIGFGEESMTDQSEMLQFSDRVKKLPLQVTQTEGEWLITTQDGIQRALIHVKPPVLDRWSELLPDPQETLDLRLYPDGKVIIDDYAHHPDELKASIRSVKDLYPNRRLTVVFQPHLYTRTRDFAPQFAEALSLADDVLLLDIYPARELPIPGVTSEIILKDIKCKNKALCNKNSLVETIKNYNFDVLLTAGAGDICNYLPQICEVVKQKH